MSEKVGEITYDVSMDTAKLVTAQRDVDRKLDTIGKYGDRLQAKFTAVAAGITAALSSIAIGGLVSKVITAQRQFDVMFASLKTMTGGVDQAGEAFARLEKFASTTPYTLEQSVGAFVKLKALGLDPSEKAMTSFGNTAAAMGKDLMQMVEAVADASTGEFERLKEFGIKARKEGDDVALTFRGTTTTIGNSASEITDYLVKIGETEFAGAMSERMKTLDGDISNLQDSLSALYRSISAAGVGDAVASGVRLATKAIQEMSTSVKEGGLTEFFDGLKPYIAAAELAVVSLAGAIAGRLVLAMVATVSQAYAAAAAVGVASVAARGFMGVLAALGGPFGIAITGLALLALNWEKVAGEATDAATMSEQAAQRIEAALSKSGGRAGKELMSQYADTQREIADIDKELSRTAFPKADPAQLDDLRARRDTLVKIAADIGTAMGKLSGSQDGRELARRGRGGTAFGDGSGTTAGGSGGTKTPGAKFDAQGYLAGLAARVADEWDKIGIIEREALRENQERFTDGKLNRLQFEEGATLIVQQAVQARQAIQDREDSERLKRIDETDKEALDRLRRNAAERDAVLQQMADEMDAQNAGKAAKSAQGQQFAAGVITGADPIAALQAELEAKSAMLAEYAAGDQANLELYAQARVALEQQTADRISEIVKRNGDQQAAQNATTLQNFGALFGSVADLTKSYAGEQSSTYRAMFAVSKAFSIAQSIVAIQAGIAQAAANPWPTNLAAMASVAASTAGIISTIQSANFGGGRQYGGPVSSGSLYRVNETGRPEMFTAANGSQYMMPTASGNVTPADQVGGGGGAVQWQVIINNAPPGTTASVDQQARLVRVAVAEVAGQIGSNSGQVWSAMRSATNIEGRL